MTLSPSPDRFLSPVSLLDGASPASGPRQDTAAQPDTAPAPRGTRAGLKVLLAALLLGAAVGCASSQHAGTKVSQLTDEQLLAEIASVDRALGTTQTRSEELLALDTDPRIVVTGATTTFDGSFNARYNAGNNSLYGNFSGNAYTTYHSYDANTWARAGKGLGLLINNLQNQQLEGRRRSVLAELQRRRKAREDAAAVAARFFAAHPEMAEQRDLFIACLYASGTELTLTLPWLQRAGAAFQSLPPNRWIGWIEAHGIPGHPQGLVVGAYAIDVNWDGDRLTGTGMGTGRQQLTLEGTRLPSGAVQGTVRSAGMQTTFVGRMTDTALSFEYSGTEAGKPIQGITWAYAKAAQATAQ